MKKKSVTIYDIAEYIGTSATTVSRALNGKGKISPEMRDLIVETAKKMNYLPNRAARYLKTQQTNQIMLSIPSVQDLFFIDIIKEVQEIATKNGYSLLVHSTQYMEEEEVRVLSSIETNFVDGVILLSLSFNKKHLDIIDPSGRPVVLCSTGNGDIANSTEYCDFIGVDSYSGFKDAANHIIKQGHKDIGYVGFFPHTNTEKERLRAFEDVMKENDLEVNWKNVLQGSPDEEFGYKAGKHFATLKKKPTAICATADMIALGLYVAFEENGVRIPDDIAVIGMDNISIDTIMRPRLSSVALSQTQMGKLAANTLFKRIFRDEEPYTSTILDTKLMVRESSMSEKYN